MKRLAIYPGSFNPFTVGHQNILEKTERLFDEVIVAVGVNRSKVPSDIRNSESAQSAMQDILEGKLSVLRQQLPSKRVEGYIGFLTDFVRKKEEEGYDEVVVIRGLRNGHDYDYEYNQTRHMWDQFPNMNIITMFCDPVYAHVSSSAYRQLESVRGGAGHHMLAVDRVNKHLREVDAIDEDEDIRI